MSQRKVVWGRVARMTTLVFATLPATAMSVVAGMGVLISLVVFFAELPTSMDEACLLLLMIAWGVAGIVGTGALWAVVLQSGEKWVVDGLVVGLLAIAPLSFIAVKGFVESWQRSTVIVGEILVATGAILLPAIALFWIDQIVISKTEAAHARLRRRQDS